MRIHREFCGRKSGIFREFFSLLQIGEGRPIKFFWKIFLFSWVQKGGKISAVRYKMGVKNHPVEYKMGAFCTQLSTIWAFLQACKGKLPYKNTHC